MNFSPSVLHVCRTTTHIVAKFANNLCLLSRACLLCLLACLLCLARFVCLLARLLVCFCLAIVFLSTSFVNKFLFPTIVHMVHEFSYIAPSSSSIDFTVINTIFKSCPMLQLSIYFVSRFTTSSKSVILLRPLTCHNPVIPGRNAMRGDGFVLLPLVDCRRSCACRAHIAF